MEGTLTSVGVFSFVHFAGDGVSVEAALEGVIVSERVRLEAQVVGHAAGMMRVLGQKATHAFLPTDPPLALRSLRAEYLRRETRWSPDGSERWLNWIVFVGEEAIGFVQATVVEGSATIGYVFHPDGCGRGYATEAVRAMIARLVALLGVRRIVAFVDTRNAPSLRLLARLGFGAIVTEYKADFFKGTFSDERMFVAEGAVLEALLG